MDLRGLEYFVAVAEERSFTRGAARVHVVQSAVSAGIARLEHEFGLALFDRSPRSVELTEAGRVLLRHARVVLGEAHRTGEAMSRLAGGVQGVVTLGTVLHNGTLDLARVLRAFHGTHPLVRVQVRLSQGSVESHVADLEDGRFDVILLPLLAGPRVRVRVEPVAELNLVLAVPLDDPLVGARDVGFAELAARRFVDYPSGWGSREMFDGLFADAGVDRDVAVEVTGVESAADMVAAGLGLAFLPPRVVEARADLVAVDLDVALPTVGLGVAVLHDRPLSGAAAALRDALVDAGAPG